MDRRDRGVGDDIGLDRKRGIAVCDGIVGGLGLHHQQASLKNV